MTKSEKALRAVRAKLSKKVVLTIEFCEGDLYLLRDRWRPEYDRAAKRYPKAVARFTDELVVKYAVWEARNRELRKALGEHGIKVKK